MQNSSEEILERSLSTLEKDRKRIWIAKGIAEFVLILFASLGLSSLFAHIYINNTYFSILKIVVILILCLGFFKFVLSTILKKERKEKLSLELEKISSGLGEDTLNAVLLTSDLNKTKNELGVSTRLIEAHVDKVSQKLRSLDFSPAVPKGRIKAYLFPLAVTLALSAGMLVLAPKGFVSFLFSIHFLPRSVPDLLELADIEIEYKYPSYTMLPSRVVKGSTGDIKAVKGTHVIFKANAIKKIDRGELLLEKGITIPLIIDSKKIEAEFTILSHGSFIIQDKGGKLRSRNFNIVSEEDKNPRVYIESTSEKIKEIGDKENLDIFYKAQDDFGLTKLILSVKTKKGEFRKPIEEIEDKSNSIEDKFTWDFSGLESEPGEIIEAAIYAYDNDTVSGPKFGVSNVIKVKLNNPRKKHNDMLASVENLLDQFLDTLADEIENNPSNNKNINNTKVIQDGISNEIERVISNLDRILEKIKDDSFSDYTYFLGLSNMKTRIEGLLDKRRDLLSSLSANYLPRLDGLISEEINEFEDDILFIDSLLKGERLKESLLYGRETLNKYNELSELIKNLKKNKDEKTRKEIEKKIEELRGLISQLAQKLGSIAMDTPIGYLNPDAFSSFDLERKLTEIMSLIEQGQMDKALSLLSSLGNDLQQMTASLERGHQSFSSSSFSEEIKELNDIISNIKGLEEGEKSLKEKTEKLKGSLLKNPSSVGALNKFVEREKKKIEALKNLLAEISAKTFSASENSNLIEGSLLVERILYEADELKHRLESHEFNKALSQAKEVEDGVFGLRNLSDLRFGRISNASREVENSAELAQEIREDLEGLFKTGEEKEKMHDLAQKQDEIKKDTARLISKISDLSKDDFQSSPKIGKKLDESKSLMQSVSNNLKGKEISKAISNQEEAIKALKQAREEANGLLEKYQLSARGMGIPVPFLIGQRESQEGINGVDTSYVDIPSAEEFKEGREFKENLLKSMKEGSPEGFSELNKNYYERIIK
ncbi:MAG: DUF4175 family protein [Candidatus Dadabacteria bacterium]|nr:DUF4175 family protein [Candidatus Dadabacteria bacterium]